MKLIPRVLLFILINFSILYVGSLLMGEGASSDWYKNSYRVFNKDYRDSIKELKKDKRKKIGLIKRLKGLFE